MRSTFAVSVAVGLGLSSAIALGSCKAREGDRCICADDCRDGLVCLAGGRVLADGECSPALSDSTEPGECLDENAAGLGEDGFPEPEMFLDLGSKRDFEPGVPPEPGTGSGSDSGTDTGTAGTSSTGTSTGTGTTSGTDSATSSTSTASDTGDTSSTGATGGT